MISFLLQHQFWAAVAVYWIFSAAVSSLPEPAGNNAGYLWLFRFLHTMAGNIDRIPAVKAMVPLLILALVLPTSACAMHYTVHPGALNVTDSAAYDTLLMAQAAIDAARADHQAGAALNALVDSYNLTRDSWLAYRAAIQSKAPNDVYFQQLNTNLTDLLTALRDIKGKEDNQ